MEITGKGRWRPATVYVVVLLGSVAFSCCVAAEFKKAQVEDIQLDGSLCSMPRSSAFGLGIAAVVCLSITQLVGTSVAATGLCRGIRSKSGAPAGTSTVPITFLVLSWSSFGLATILLGTGSSMNDRQRYGKGWLDGNCYVVKDGVFIGAAVLVIAAVVFILGFTFSTRATKARSHWRTGPGPEDNHQGDQVQFKDGI